MEWNFNNRNIILRLFTFYLLCSKFGSHCQQQICPSECLCYDRKEVKQKERVNKWRPLLSIHFSQAHCFFGNNVGTILQTLPDEIQQLTIKGGNITRLKNEDFIRYKHLRELKMSANNLMRISPYTFANMTNLRKIYIENNALSELEPYSFADVKTLHELFLAGNRIRRVRKFAFDKSSMNTIDLRYNPTEALESNAFSNLNTVGTLHFPSNISRIQANAFENLTNVHFMDFNSLNLQFIGPDTFRRMGPVHSVSIKDSNLGLIKSNAFAEMASSGIANLVIQGCRIKRIRRLSFANAKIGKLELNRNVIDRLENGAFENSERLKFEKNTIDCRRCDNVYWLVSKDITRLIDDTVCLPTSESSADAKETFVHESKREFLKNCDPITSLTDEDYDEDFTSSANRRDFFSTLFTVLVVVVSVFS